MMAPASGQVAAKLNITSSLEQEMTVSIFVLGFAVGPLFWGPASEIFGRIRVLQLANLLYLIFNLVCAWAPNKAAFIVFRFIAGLGGGAPLSVGAGVLSDLWRAEERGKGAALYSLGPLLGPALGPVMGAWIVEKVPNDGYRWIFISTTIVRRARSPSRPPRPFRPLSQLQPRRVDLFVDALVPVPAVLGARPAHRPLRPARDVRAGPPSTAGGGDQE